MLHVLLQYIGTCHTCVVKTDHTYVKYLIKVLTMGLQRKQDGQNTWSTIVSILSESHQDLSATKTFFWTCHFPLWCNSCCGDARIVYKYYLQDGNVVAKDSGVVTTNRSCPVYVKNKTKGEIFVCFATVADWGRLR